MAISDLESLYPGRALAPDADYPQGAVQDESTTGALDGTPVKQDWLRDIQGAIQAVIAAGGVTPSGNPDTAVASDFLDALNEVIDTTLTGVREGHNIEASAYTGQSFDGVAQETIAAQDLAVSSDGLKLYIYQTGGVSELFEYDLDSPFEISSATYNSVVLDMSSENTFSSVEFSDDGLKLWGTVSGIIYPYTLSTAWDISTASYDGATVDLTTQDTMQTISFSPDGLKMAAAGNTNDNIYTYTLSTAWDISTATYDGVALDYSGEVTASEIKLSVSSNGSKLFLGRAATGGGIIEYDLLNAWDLTNVLRTTNHTQFGTDLGGYIQQHFTFSPAGDYLLLRSDDPLSSSNSLVLSFATGVLR